MQINFLKTCSRTGLICIETVAVILGIFILLGGLLAWRLMASPLDISFAKNYVSQSLQDPTTGFSIDFEKVYAHWPSPSDPMHFKLENIALHRNDRNVLNIAAVDLSLATGPLFTGSIKPVLIELTDLEVFLIRTTDNEFRLSLEDDVTIESTTESPNEDNPLTRIAKRLSEPLDSIDRRSPISQLQAVNIHEAKLVIEDHGSNTTWSLPELNLGFARAAEGLKVNAHAQIAESETNINLDMMYDRTRNVFDSSLSFKNFDPHFVSEKFDMLCWINDHQMSFDGKIDTVFTPELEIRSIMANVETDQAMINLPDQYNDPLKLENIGITATYSGIDKQAVLEKFEFTLQDFTTTVSAKADIQIQEDMTVISAPITVSIPNLPQSNIKPLWPKALEGEGAEIWLTEKISEGHVKDAQLNIHLSAIQEYGEWTTKLNSLTADFQIADMLVDYRAPLFPAENMNATGHFDLNTDELSFNIESANISQLKVPSGTVTIENVSSAKQGQVTVNMDMEGPLGTLFDYIANEPIGMTPDQIGLEGKNVQGQAKLNVNVKFPTIRDLLAKQVIVKAKGTLTDTKLPKLIKGLDLAGGPFNLDVADGAAMLKGTGKLDNHPVTFDWKQYVSAEGKPFSSRVKAKVDTNAALRRKLGVDLSDWVAGTVPVDIVYTEHANDTATLKVEGTLAPAKLMITPFNYEKKEGTEGTVQCTANFKEGHIENIENLTVTTPELSLEKGELHFILTSASKDAFLKQGYLPHFKLNENDLSIEFEREVKDDLLKMVVKGPFFDARPFLKNKEKENNKEEYAGPPLEVSVTADRMRTHPARLVENAKIYLRMDTKGRPQQFEMDAQAGKGDVYLRLKPDDTNKMTLRLEADDAGALLQAFDVYDSMQSGKLVLYGEAVSPEAPYEIEGNFQITEFDVINAPVLAQVVNAISPTGLGALLGNEGIHFTKMDGGFKWQIRPEGDIYEITEGRTSGSSLGLTFDGIFDMAKRYMDLKGTVVPISAINRLVSNIPLIGDILAGGSDGAVFAATYSIKGPTETPKVSVNPLAALTPGILRRILFEQEDDQPQETPKQEKK